MDRKIGELRPYRPEHLDAPTRAELQLDTPVPVVDSPADRGHEISERVHDAEVGPDLDPVSLSTKEFMEWPFEPTRLEHPPCHVEGALGEVVCLHLGEGFSDCRSRVDLSSGQHWREPVPEREERARRPLGAVTGRAEWSRLGPSFKLAALESDEHALGGRDLMRGRPPRIEEGHCNMADLDPVDSHSA